jgi:LuxR family maltose regulon positive regulatory protein
MAGFPAKPGEIEVFINAYTAAVPYASASLNGYLYGLDTLARAELAYYQGDLNKAEQFARQAVYQSREKKQYEVENRALFYLMRICIHTGNIPECRDIMRQMEAQLENPDYISRYTIHDIIMGRFYTRLGLTGRIAPWLKMENKEGELNILFRGFDTLVKARYLFSEKDYASALKILEEEKHRGNLGSFLLGMLEISALEAITRYKLDDREGAFAALEQAYEASSPNSLDMPFIELGANMYTLVNTIIKARTEENTAPIAEKIPLDWLRDIRRKASAYAKTLSLAAAEYESRDGSGPEDFSDHELAVLNNLAEGFTGEQIAANMKISVKMVNSAVRTLYTKLGAANRADAVRIAAAKGLLKGED